MARHLAVSLGKAKELYESGKYARAGRTLGDARLDALRHGDSLSVALVDEWITWLLGRLEGDERDAFEEGLGAVSRVSTSSFRR
jgi:hypothetical protein